MNLNINMIGYENTLEDMTTLKPSPCRKMVWPIPMLEGGIVTVLWNFVIYTNNTIQPNRPVLIIKVFEIQWYHTDMSILSVKKKHISTEEFDKLPKYKGLEIVIARMWHLNLSTVPVIVGALWLKRIQMHPLRKFQETRHHMKWKTMVLNDTHLFSKTLSI